MLLRLRVMALMLAAQTEGDEFVLWVAGATEGFGFEIAELTLDQGALDVRGDVSVADVPPAPVDEIQ